jgi:hypothetical protein
LVNVIKASYDYVDGSESGYQNERPSVGLKTVTESRAECSAANGGRLVEGEESREHFGRAVQKALTFTHPKQNTGNYDPREKIEKGRAVERTIDRNCKYDGESNERQIFFEFDSQLLFRHVQLLLSVSRHLDRGRSRRLEQHDDIARSAPRAS